MDSTRLRLDLRELSMELPPEVGGGGALSTPIRHDTIAFAGTHGTAMPTDAHVEKVLHFWFGELDGNGMSVDPGRWWKVDPHFDTEIKAIFGELYRCALRGDCRSWESSARGRLALIVLLDQFSRNMFRDQAEMYDHDETSIALTLEGIELGLDRSLGHQERVFFYIPLIHSEQLDHQELALVAFAALADEAPEGARSSLLNNVSYAQKHLDIVERWGRFPHRNIRLGRPSTDAELAFLKTPGSSF